MGKYTLVASYKGGAYISQYCTVNPFAAERVWANNLSAGFFSREELLEIQKRVYRNYCSGEGLPVPAAKPISSVWQNHYDIFGQDLRLDIIQTALW